MPKHRLLPPCEVLHCVTWDLPYMWLTNLPPPASPFWHAVSSPGVAQILFQKTLYRWSLSGTNKYQQKNHKSHTKHHPLATGFLFSLPSIRCLINLQSVSTVNMMMIIINNCVLALFVEQQPDMQTQWLELVTISQKGKVFSLCDFSRAAEGGNNFPWLL